MALTSTTAFDVIGQTQTISFYVSNALVDQITYSSNLMTFESISAFNMSKQDFILYYQFANIYNILLSTNFPLTSSTQLGAWPEYEFDIKISSSGTPHLYFTQKSGTTSVMDLTYTPSNSLVGFAKRQSPVTVSRQEFFTTINMLSQYQNQVALN